MPTKIFNGKRYKYYGSQATKHMALRWAKEIRNDRQFYVRVAKDPRKSASTWHVYVRNKR